MAHPKHVELARFYNSVGRKFEDDDRAGPKYPSFSNNARLKPGDIGFGVEGATSPDRTYHVRHGIGLSSCVKETNRIFIKLPGRTFNDNTFSMYMGNASTARSALMSAQGGVGTRLGSPLRHRDVSPVKGLSFSRPSSCASSIAGRGR